MKDEHLLQPILDYVKPAHSSLFMVIYLSLLGAFFLFWGIVAMNSESAIVLLIGLALLLFAGLSLRSHFKTRNILDTAVLQAAEKYGATMLANDFRHAASHFNNKLRLGNLMLYSQRGNGLAAYRDLKTVKIIETTDEDGDKSSMLCCYTRDNCFIDLCDERPDRVSKQQIEFVCNLINQRIAAANPEGSSEQHEAS